MGDLNFFGSVSSARHKECPGYISRKSGLLESTGLAWKWRWGLRRVVTVHAVGKKVLRGLACLGGIPCDFQLGGAWSQE